MLLDQKSVCTDLGVEINLEDKASKIEVRDRETEIVFFERMKESGDLFEVTFSMQDKGGNLLAYKGKWIVKMLRVDIDKERSERNYEKDAEDLINNTYAVRVKYIDYDEKIIFVSRRYYPKEKQRSIAISTIDKKLKEKELIIVPAKIVGVGKYEAKVSRQEFSVVYIDIAGLGIPGSIHIKQWANAFVPNVQLEAKKGDIVYVVVYKKHQVKGKTMYLCSRKDYHKHIGYEPWDLVSQRLKVNMNVRLTVVDSKPEKGIFFGAIEGIPYVNVLCHNPDGVKEVRIGTEWMGFVQKLDVENKYLHVKVLEKLTKAVITEKG